MYNSRTALERRSMILFMFFYRNYQKSLAKEKAIIGYRRKAWNALMQGIFKCGMYLFT
jgi:hypothetical protein